MDVIYLVAFVVLVLATARLTRLICKDDLTHPIRTKIDKALGQNSFWSRLIWCHWCVGVWVSLGTSSFAMKIAYDVVPMPPWAAILTWLILIPANAYAASWVIDMEKGE